MSISRISGNMLKDNLVRDANISIQTSLLYVDVTNGRIGVNTSTTTHVLTVNGDTNVTANVYASAVVSSALSSNSALTVQTAANGNITLQPNGTGIVTVNSTTGMVIPVGNVAQRPVLPDTGTLRFNTSTDLVEVFDGLAWDPVGANYAEISSQQFAGDNTTTIFGLTKVTSTAAIIVSINGVLQAPNVAYTVLDDQITFTEAPLATDIIEIRFIAEMSVVRSVANASGTSSLTITDAGVVDTSTTHSLQLPVYTVAQALALTSVSNGQVIYVSNGNAGQPCLAVYSATTWKVVSLGATISAT